MSPKRIAPGVLTPREVEVLELAAAGLSRSEIGRALWLAPDTIKTHLGHASQALGYTASTAESVAVAVRVGYLEVRGGHLRGVTHPDPARPALARLRAEGRLPRPQWILDLPAERRGRGDRRLQPRDEPSRRATPPRPRPPTAPPTAPAPAPAAR